MSFAAADRLMRERNLFDVRLFSFRFETIIFIHDNMKYSPKKLLVRAYKESTILPS